jgi:hypothetical protein
MVPMLLPEEIQSELNAGQKALGERNEGKARVCARRAVGKAFDQSMYSEKVERVTSANEIVKLIADDERFSAEVRNAARRLSANVLEMEISRKPIDDALVIIAGLLPDSR